MQRGPLLFLQQIHCMLFSKRYNAVMPSKTSSENRTTSIFIAYIFLCLQQKLYITLISIMTSYAERSNPSPINAFTSASFFKKSCAVHICLLKLPIQRRLLPLSMHQFTSTPFFNKSCAMLSCPF